MEWVRISDQDVCIYPLALAFLEKDASLSLERYSGPTSGPGDDISRMRKMNDVENHVGD
jgi:hypothetical protein